jgi:hypothetical protein
MQEQLPDGEQLGQQDGVIALTHAVKTHKTLSHLDISNQTYELDWGEGEIEGGFGTECAKAVVELIESNVRQLSSQELCLLRMLCD